MATLRIALFSKKVLLRIVTFCILSAFTVGIMPVTAYTSSMPSITGEVVYARPNDTVKVNINLSNNPGIVSATIHVDFDSGVLSLTKVTDGGLLGVQSHKPEYTSPYTLAWVNDTATKNYTSNGTIATLTFVVNKNAVRGNAYPVKITYDYDNYDIYDKDLNSIYFNVSSGIIKVATKNHRFILGDVNSDNTINNLDVYNAQQYIAQIKSSKSIDVDAADVDYDGFVTVIDVTFIQRYLVGFEIPYSIGKTI